MILAKKSVKYNMTVIFNRFYSGNLCYSDFDYNLYDFDL